MPDYSKTFDDNRLQFRQDMFAKFLASDYWEAGMDDVKLHLRYNLFLADTLFELLDNEVETILGSDAEPITLDVAEYEGVAV